MVIPVFNALRYLPDCIDSALALADVAELLVVDDGSTDGSLDYCLKRAKGDPRIHVLQHRGGENLGAAESRNLGIRHAQSDYISFLDADDFYLPNRFDAARRIFASMDADGVYDAVGTKFETDEMRSWWREKGRNELSTVRIAVPSGLLFEHLIGSVNSSFHTNGIVVRRALFGKTGLFVPALRMCQDTAMWLQFAAVGQLHPGSLDVAVAVRRLHGENRIFRQQREHAIYRFSMWRHLLEWGHGAGLAPHRQTRLAMAIIASACELDDGELRSITGKSRLGLLLEVAIKRPQLLKSRFYWRLLARALGVARLKGSLLSQPRNP